MFEVFHVTPKSTHRMIEKFGRGRSVTRVQIVIEEPFAPGAKLLIGTESDPGSVIGENDVDLSSTDHQYVSNEIYRLESPMRLQLKADAPLEQGHAIVYLQGT